MRSHLWPLRKVSGKYSEFRAQLKAVEQRQCLEIIPEHFPFKTDTKGTSSTGGRGELVEKVGNVEKDLVNKKIIMY